MAALEQTIQELGQAFEEFKKTNDERLSKVEKGQPTGDLDQKLAQINQNITALEATKKELDEALKKMQRSGLGGDGNGVTQEVKEHQKAFGGFLRKGAEEGLHELEKKALQIAVGEDGGFAVPEVLDQQILQMERNEVTMRSLGKVISLGNENYKKLVNLGGANAGWVGETEDRPETDAPKLGEVSLYYGEIYANPAATQKSLDDVFFNAEAWLASEVAEAFSEQENAAFIHGNGTKKPKGILAYPTSTAADRTRAYGTLQHVMSGAAAGINPDQLISLVYSLKAKYRRNAAWLMATGTVEAIRKLKDDNGNYLWRPGLDAGEPSTLLSRPLHEEDEMPELADGEFSIAFGDFKRGYVIADIHGTRVLRDPYTRKPFVQFYTTKRVGGGVVDTRAIKLLKVGM